MFQFYKMIFNLVYLMFLIIIYLIGFYYLLDEIIKGFLNLIVSFKFCNLM